MTHYSGKKLGAYQILNVLGHGGFADVYLGEHAYLKTSAAIKVLHTHIQESDVESVLAEAQIVAALRHPHIVRIHDFGLEDHCPFMVMDYAPYGTLRQRHPKGSQVPLLQVVSYVKQLASALQYAHENKVIHRDLKPENVLLERENHLVLSDFGIAVIVHSSRSLTTQNQAGTIPYMAPEQIQGKVQRASDQYALGIMAYEWLIGVRPFEGSYWEIMSQHLHASPPSLREKVPTLSPEVEQVILTALAKDPCQRYPTVATFAEALEKASTKPPLGETFCVYAQHSALVNAVAWSPDSTRIASAAGDERVLVWEIETGKTLFTLDCYYDCSDESGHEDEYSDVDVLDVAWSPDGTKIASGDFVARVLVWNAITGRQSLLYDKHWPGQIDHPVWRVCWSPNSKYVFSQGSDEQIWDAETGETLRILKTDQHGLGIAWSPDGTRIAYAGLKDGIHVCSFLEGQTTTLVYECQSDYVHHIAWSPNGRYIASSGDDQTIHIWNSMTGKTLVIYEGHVTDEKDQDLSKGVRAFAWSPDSTRIASGLYEGVHIWNALTGEFIYIYPKQESIINALAWSPNGRFLASASAGEDVHIWHAL